MLPISRDLTRGPRNARHLTEKKHLTADIIGNKVENYPNNND